MRIGSVIISLLAFTLLAVAPAGADKRRTKNIIMLENSEIVCADIPATRPRQKSKVTCLIELTDHAGRIDDVRWQVSYFEIGKRSNYSNHSRRLTITPKSPTFEVSATIKFKGKEEKYNRYIVSGKHPKKKDPTTPTTTTSTTTTTTLPTTTTTSTTSTTTTTNPPPTTTTSTTSTTTTTNPPPTTTTSTTSTTTTTLPNFGGDALSNPNPVTTALTGSHATYNIGPNQTYTECNNVPFGALVAGDVVNIYYRATPYKCKFGLRVRATATAKVYINGVTDAFGNRPVLDFNGARTAAGSNPGAPNNVFTTTPAYGETLAGIIVKRGASDDYESPKPAHIVIQNLELRGAANGNNYTTLAGATQKYDSSAGIWIQVGDDITIQNNVITDNGFGIFTMAKNETLAHTAERLVIRNNRIHNNGVANSYLEHNLYIQAKNPLVEGNYIGLTRKNSQGASYKSRSSGEIFRYNYVVASARAIDLVHSEENGQGIAAQADYGTDYVYGNTIYNDCTLTNCASNPIHYGGDNWGEQDGSSSIFNPGVPYRSRLYFFGNTVINRSNLADAWRLSVFDLSLAGTTVHAWNNIFANFGTSNTLWTEYAGKINFYGKNHVLATNLADHHEFAYPGHTVITQYGSFIFGDPKFTNLGNEDFSLQADSTAINQATSYPAGLPNNLAAHPVLFQPNSGLNGMVPRTVTGGVPDLGAFEFGVP